MSWHVMSCHVDQSSIYWSEWRRDGDTLLQVLPWCHRILDLGNKGKIRRKQQLAGLVLYVDVDVDLCTVPVWSRRRLKIDLTWNVNQQIASAVGNMTKKKEELSNSLGAVPDYYECNAVQEIDIILNDPIWSLSRFAVCSDEAKWKIWSTTWNCFINKLHVYEEEKYALYFPIFANQSDIRRRGRWSMTHDAWHMKHDTWSWWKFKEKMMEV